ncbi:MAG: hypothetical protein ACKOD9_07015, partial [Rubrivivax sp.]
MPSENRLHQHLDALLAALKGSVRLSRQRRRAQERLRHRSQERLQSRQEQPGRATARTAQRTHGLGLHLLAAVL